MGINFPNEPINGETFSAGNVTYVWTGSVWEAQAVASASAITDDEAPPSSPAPQNGQLWWNSTNGYLYVWYNDGSSAQWVQVSPVPVSEGAADPLGYRGFLHGLTLSNNASDATNDIDIATGVAASDVSSPVLMELAADITKRLDAAWAVGTGNGGLDTGTIANTTYHVWLIQRSDTGVTDVLFSASATSPTMPASYDRKRRIGSIIRAAGAIVTFWQNGDVFRRGSVTDRSNTAAASSALLTLSVPTGIVVAPINGSQLYTNLPPCSVGINLGSASTGSADVTVSTLTAPAGVNAGEMFVIASVFYTNTSAQLYFSQTNFTGTPVVSELYTNGWIDTRGRLA